MQACFECVNLTASRYPQKTSVDTMNIERLAIAQHQLHDELVEKEHLTVETDETKKYYKALMNQSVRDEDGRSYVLGLREMPTKSAQDTMNVLTDVLFDLDTLSGDENLKTVSADILFKIRNTMSDRAATEEAFNSLLEDYRAQILPEVVDNWEQLDKIVQEKLTRLNNFFCGLHTLVHAAESANLSCQEVEKSLEGPEPLNPAAFKKAGESGTVRLTRTACNAFSTRGDQKNGCHGRFVAQQRVQEFLKEKKMRALPLQPFKGNRFNIVFASAGAVYFLHQEMTEFLEQEKSNPWVLGDLKIPQYVAGCKALGLISKYITTPLWHLIEDKSVHIMDLAKPCLELTTFLTDACQNLTSFMGGNMRLSFGNVKEDAILTSLLEPSKYDEMCEQHLGVVLAALAMLFKRLFADFLPGGKYSNPSEELRKITTGTAKHNKFCETVFGFTDYIMRTRPNISVLAIEANVMYSYNKTVDWLSGKSDAERNDLLKKAKANAKVIRRRFKERLLVIKARKAEDIRLKLEAAQQKEARQLAQRTTITNDVIHWGLWQSTYDSVLGKRVLTY